MFHGFFKENFKYLTEYFESAFSNQKHSIAQSIILYGQDTLAQYYFAMEISRILNCTKTREEDCGCLNCSWIRGSRHPAVLTISKNDNKPSDDTSKKVISIKQIHMINNSLVQSSDYYRVFIFCDSEIEEISLFQQKKLEKFSPAGFLLPDTGTEKKWFPYPVKRDVLQAEAANALLKSIEEPPEKVLFIFLARDRDDIIETIVSRSQAFYVPSLPEIEYDIETAASLLADYPDIQKKEVLKLVQSILSVQQEKDYKTEFLLDSFQYYFAQLMKNNLDNKLLVNKLKKDILSIQKAKKELNSYIKPQLILENLMFGLC